MDLYVDTYGTSIRKNGNLFQIKTEEQKSDISPLNLKTMILSKGVSISTDAIEMAVENNIDIVVLDGYGDPYGRFWHCKFGSTAYIRRKQLEILKNNVGTELAKNWLINKIKNYSIHLRDLKTKRESKKDYIEAEMIKIQKYIYKIKLVTGNINDNRNTLMGYEGNAGKLYYGVLSELVPKEYKFEGRSMRPAKDEFNSLLNYAFGILYSKVEKCCVIAGLDPYIGLLHTDNYGKKSLVFDIIENYRHLANRVVFQLFSQKKVNKSFFDVSSSGMLLNKSGKHVLVEEFYKLLDKKIKYNGRHITNLEKIQYDCHEIANSLIEKEKIEG
ncbi:MAG: CRISPR-associated endonuclease Cas1 [Pseudoleptotrichia goodfellowii]|jgi:CRISPR-associated endonuclease Cas1|nr:CRISPR-associated endonuclease Cas1 [Pseudoleptotrichia goodfellowii]